MNGKRVLVTGSAGFIGYHLVKTIQERFDCEIWACDNFIRGSHDAAYESFASQPNAHSVSGDLTEREALAALPGSFDYIFHLAALNGTQNFYEKPFSVLLNSTLPTLFLIEKYVLTGSVGRFVYAGSSESYATTVERFNWPVPTDESVPLSIESAENPRWSYAISKTHGEVAVATCCAAHAVPYTILRYHNVYGPRMGDKHVIPDFISRMDEGRYELYGWEDTRSFIYVDDAVDASILSSTSDKTANQVVNIGSPDDITMIALGRMILSLAGIQAEIQCFPSPKGSVSSRAADITKLVAATGFKPRWSLEAGLRAVLASRNGRSAGPKT